MGYLNPVKLIPLSCESCSRVTMPNIFLIVDINHNNKSGRHNNRQYISHRQIIKTRDDAVIVSLALDMLTQKYGNKKQKDKNVDTNPKKMCNILKWLVELPAYVCTAFYSKRPVCALRNFIILLYNSLLFKPLYKQTVTNIHWKFIWYESLNR